MSTANMQRNKSTVSFPGAVKLGFRRYVDFKGRSTRAEFWRWVLFIFLAGIALQIVDRLIGANWSAGSGPFRVIFFLLTLVPGVAVTTRRLHDIGKSGWWQLAWFGVIWGTLIVCWIVVIVLFVVAAKNASLPSGTYAYLGFHSLVGWAALPIYVAMVVTVVATLAVAAWPIVWLARQGQPDLNRFGTDPRAPESP